MSQMLLNGADDYLSKPFSIAQLLGKTRMALRLKAAQDRAVLLDQQLHNLKAVVECNAKGRESNIQQTRDALTACLARLIDQREARGRNHTPRLRRSCRALAVAAMNSPAFAGQIDEAFVELLDAVTPLYDLGKITLPDHVLLKGGALTLEERIVMQTHTSAAAEALHEAAMGYPGAAVFMQMATDVVRHHHERFDGSGYPDALAGDAISLAARIVAIAEVYDALRCRRSWKPALSHASALQIMNHASTGQFDPHLLEIFQGIGSEIEGIFHECPD